jgi:hypothetical protein
MRIIDLLVEEKVRVQQQLAEEAGDDTEKYFALIHRLALATQEQYGLTFKYGVPEGFEPPVGPTPIQLR